MKPLVAGVFASFAVLSFPLISACSSDKLASPSSSELSIPVGITVAPDASLPTGFTIPDQSIDLMISQFEEAGMKVDKTCLTNLLKDDAVRKLVAASGATPSADVIAKFYTCLVP